MRSLRQIATMNLLHEFAIKGPLPLVLPFFGILRSCYKVVLEGGHSILPGYQHASLHQVAAVIGKMRPSKLGTRSQRRFDLGFVGARDREDGSNGLGHCLVTGATPSAITPVSSSLAHTSTS